MSFFNIREETSTEIKIILKSTSWQNYINLLFFLCVLAIRFIFWEKKSQGEVNMKFLLLSLGFVGLWMIIGITINLGNRKAVKEINRAVKEGKKIQSVESPFSIKNPRTITISK